uniref:Uncharacterized protein n=1 Tax=Acrobeloides nanus TaxID=290746 RepID=A0A914E4C8_9BILA
MSREETYVLTPELWAAEALSGAFNINVMFNGKYFNAEISAEELETLLSSWKIRGKLIIEVSSCKKHDDGIVDILTNRLDEALQIETDYEISDDDSMEE